MRYIGRVTVVFIYVFIVLAWHSFYFLVDFQSSYDFMFTKGLYIWDLVFIPLLSPFFWWLGSQYDNAKYLSEKDALTGLYNRRFISIVSPKLLDQMDRKKEKLSVSLLDCNNFKQINDTYGHKTGDLVLKNISRLLVKNTRNCDVVGRWGGDEFLIIAPFTDTEGTKVVIRKIQKGIQELSKEMGMELSVSVGTSVYPEGANNMDDLIKSADRNMYELKALSKKNRSDINYFITTEY